MSKDNYTKTLEEELTSFRNEKERVRQLVGQIGGKKDAKTTKLINIIFLGLLLVLFVFELTINIFDLSLPFITTKITISIALLMVSLKIIWMIHKQSKLDHFQFWILNSIEFRLNDVSERLIKIEKNLNKDNR